MSTRDEIRRVLIAGDTHGNTAWVEALTTRAAEQGCPLIIQVGDFGYFPDHPDGPRFLAVSAASFFPDYAPVLPGVACVELGLDDACGAVLYCLVTVPDGDVTAATANLRAPLVVNPDTHQARQLVLTDGVHPIRRPLRR